VKIFKAILEIKNHSYGCASKNCRHECCLAQCHVKNATQTSDSTASAAASPRIQIANAALLSQYVSAMLPALDKAPEQKVKSSCTAHSAEHETTTDGAKKKTASAFSQRITVAQGWEREDLDCDWSALVK